MDRYSKSLKRGLQQPDIQQQLADKASTHQQVRSSSLDQQNHKDLQIKHGHKGPCPVQRRTEADAEGSDSSKCDKDSETGETSNEDINKDLKDIKRIYSEDGGLPQNDSYKPNITQSSCDDKNNMATNKGEDFGTQTNPLQSGLNSLKKEPSVAESGAHTENKLLSCFFCETKFVTGGLLTLHTSVHTGEKLLSCIVCKRTFGLETELKSHLCAVETSPDHQSRADDQTSILVYCSQCGEAFSSREDLSVHFRRHTREDTFRCSICGTCCSDRDSLIQHMRIHTRQTQFTCSVCGKDFAWRRHLTKHMEVHKKKKKVFRCRICAAEFYTYYLLSKHKPVHQSSELSHSQENEKMETAGDGEDCGGPESVRKLNSDTGSQPESDVETLIPYKTKEPQSDLTSVGVSEVSESETKTNIQQLADGQNPSPNTLHTELQKEVKQEDPEPPRIKEEPEETEIPEFTFASFPIKTEEDEEKPQSSELHHSQAEESRQSVEEPEPDKNGTTSDFSDSDTDDSDCWKQKRKPQPGSNSESDSGRNQFSRSGNGPSEFLQPESDDSVDSDFWKDDRKPQSNLNSSKHEASEVGVKYVTDLKPYSCIQCSKAFRYNSYLKIHMRQHTEKYFCSVCGHKSTSSSNLKVHMRTHTGEKPFSCQICDKKYTNKASLQSHMTVHTAERKYSCDVCKKSFAWYTELKYHKCVGESSHEQTYEENTGINLKRHTSYS